MGKFMKPGKVVLVLAGRYSGRKAVIVKVSVGLGGVPAGLLSLLAPDGPALPWPLLENGRQPAVQPAALYLEIPARAVLVFSFPAGRCAVQGGCGDRLAQRECGMRFRTSTMARLIGPIATPWWQASTATHGK